MKKAFALTDATLPLAPSLLKSPSSPSSGSVPVVYTPATEEQRKAAAAAARRKRRKTLARRNQARNRQKRLKTSHNEVVQPTEVSKRPLSSVSPISLVIRPTVEGMRQVASKLTEGLVVAIPTECTYEVATQLNMHEQGSWSDRIQLLYDAASSVKQAEDGLGMLRPGNAVSFCSATSVDGDHEGDDEDNNNGNSNEETILQTVTTANPSLTGSPLRVSHVYVHQAALEGPFWRKCLPKRPFAVRNKEGEVLAAHAFNESQQLVRMLANKVWPGPCMIYVAVEQDLPGLTVTRLGKRYIALRSVCHPLTVKVYQEFHHQSAPKLQQERRSSTSSSSSSPAVVDPILASPGRSASPVPASDFLLVGTTLYNAATAYVTRAEQAVATDLTVLNGEESHDIFAVPPCEYGHPCPDSIWLDTSQRQVVLCNHGDSTRLTSEQLLQALQIRNAPKTDKDRVIQAVLGRWKVVVEK